MTQKIGNLIINFICSDSKYRLGFPITENDEVRMLRACISAVRFMRTYGQGSEPYTMSETEQIINSNEQR